MSHSEDDEKPQLRSRAGSAKVASRGRGARGVLSVPSGTGAVRLKEWMRKHDSAREFLETWLDMRSSGESDWSARRVFWHLRSEFGLPTRSEPAFYRFLRYEYAERAEQAIAPI